VQKRMQKWTVIAIIAILSISLIGSSFVSIFQPGTQDQEQGQSQAVLEKEYEERQEKVEDILKKLEESPQDIQIKQTLGDAYYEKSVITRQLNMNEYKEDLENAIESYQAVLTAKEDNQVLLRLATSAFLLGESELAEKSYTSLVAKEPENVDALYGYGMFLLYDKDDHKQAEEQWKKALALTTDEQMKIRLQEMVTLVEGMNIDNTSEQKDK